MIEITFADMFLLLWAILATVFCIVYREQEESHKKFIGLLIRDKKSRERFFDGVDKHVTDEGEDATLKP
jgi:hypothetical protein